MIPTIKTECSEFLRNCGGNYIVKNLPTRYDGFAKVKVRLKKTKTPFVKSFNKAFESKKHALHNRSVLGYSDVGLLTEESSTEPFYIFPINGYEFIYNPEIENASIDYKNIGLSGNFIQELLAISYRTGDLREAISSKCEIVFYGIPYYYALRRSLITEYYSYVNINS
jgi:hypothetical protein